MIGKQIEQNTRNGGSPVWCVTGLLWEGLVRLGLVMWRFCGAFLRHFGSLGAPFGVILAVLERFWASFWVSWALLVRPFGPSWPKLAQDSEKTSIFWIWLPAGGPKLGAKIEKKRCQERCFFQMRFCHRFLSIFHWFWVPNFDVFWIDFRRKSENADFVKNSVSPRRER